MKRGEKIMGVIMVLVLLTVGLLQGTTKADGIGDMTLQTAQHIEETVIKIIDEVMEK